MVICKLQEQNDDRPKIAAIIKDSKQLSYSFVHVSCDFNQVAHFITTEGLKKRENSYLVSRVFSNAEDVVLADRRGLLVC